MTTKTTSETPAFVDFSNNAENINLKAAGIVLCPKCGSKKLTNSENKLICANNLADCPLLK